MAQLNMEKRVVLMQMQKAGWSGTEISKYLSFLHFGARSLRVPKRMRRLAERGNLICQIQSEQRG